MSEPRRTWTKARAFAFAALAVLGATYFARVDRGIAADGSGPNVEPPATPVRPLTGTSAPGSIAHERASTPTRAPSVTKPEDGTSVVGRLMTQRRPEDLELLSSVARTTSAPPPRAVHHLLDAARAGADDAELTRIIREDVQGALVRHHCFEWLRRRRGEPRPKLPAFAVRGPRSDR